MNLISKISDKKISRRFAIIIGFIAILQILFALAPNLVSPIFAIVDYEFWAIVESVTVPITTLIILLYIFQKLDVAKAFKNSFIWAYLFGLALGAGFILFQFDLTQSLPPMIQAILSPIIAGVAYLIGNILAFSLGVTTLGFRGAYWVFLISGYFVALVLIPITFGLIAILGRKIWMKFRSLRRKS